MQGSLGVPMHLFCAQSLLFLQSNELLGTGEDEFEGISKDLKEGQTANRN